MGEQGLAPDEEVSRRCERAAGGRGAHTGSERKSHPLPPTTLTLTGNEQQALALKTSPSSPVTKGSSVRGIPSTAHQLGLERKRPVGSVWRGAGWRLGAAPPEQAEVRSPFTVSAGA